MDLPFETLTIRKDQKNRHSSIKSEQEYFFAAMGVLTIYLDKCTDIADTDLGTDGDPYVVFELEQDNVVRRNLFRTKTQCPFAGWLAG